MALPLFFHDGALQEQAVIQPDEDTARHIAQVLRMSAGDTFRLTDGKGTEAQVSITKAEKKKLWVEVRKVKHHEKPRCSLHLCVAFTKNTGRNEWLLEKATELGVASIVPVLASRTERQHYRRDRWTNILVAALLQSQQFHLPLLHEATAFENILQRFNDLPQKLIGHCIDDLPRNPLSRVMAPHQETVVLIGPEGDFTQQEVALAASKEFIGFSLVGQRLRTETAAMAVCSYFSLINHEV